MKQDPEVHLNIDHEVEKLSFERHTVVEMKTDVELCLNKAYHHISIHINMLFESMS